QTSKPVISADKIAIQQSKEYDCRVVLVTGVDPDTDIINMGFDTYLTKPTGSGELCKAVEDVIDRAAHDDQVQRYYRLIEKQTTLEATKPQAELAQSEEYRQLQAEIDRVREEMSDTLTGIADDETLLDTFQNITRE
ncbi:MAG: HalX domain-containing protein, partial [Salinirussus sp.]